MPKPLSPRRDYFSTDTIAAPASGSGGAVAILRISGPETARTAESLCPGLRWGELEPGMLRRQRLVSRAGALIDDALIVRFQAPHSFTGEDVFEIHHHGNPLIAARLMREAAECGVRPALPGEFSFRAVRNGKMSLSQAEALADLIAASHDSAASLALEKLSGSQQDLISGIAEEIRQATAYGELGIDFSDQDIEELGPAKLRERLGPPLEKLRALDASFRRGILLQEGVKTTIIGAPNAGKSSFFNALLGEERAIVTEIAGTTRDELRETLVLESGGERFAFRLSDTAGLRRTADRVEKIGIERAVQAAANADLLLWVVEVSRSKDPVPALPEGVDSRRVIGILSKCDTADSTAIQARKTQLIRESAVSDWVETSAIQGRGLQAAAELMISRAREWTRREPGEVLLTRLDHRNAVQEAMMHLERAMTAPGLDLLAADLRQTLHALAPLIGRTVADDILGRIFSRFCIGK